MPRKKQGPVISPVALLVTIGALLIVGPVMAYLAQNGLLIAALCFILLAVVIITFVLVPRWRLKNLLEHVDTRTNEHIDALVRQRVTLIRNDPYGKPILDKWQAEVNYFITQHVRPALNPGQQSLLDRKRQPVLQQVWQRVEAALQQRPAFATVPQNITPAQFEAFCSESLRNSGWGVRLTPLCRDQGVDVIAERNGVRVVLQCKLYSNPVGNKAVQEIAAGRIHQQAHYGAVVTNSTYTPSAKELATTNGILLLHYTDLPQLEQVLNKLTVQ